MLIEVDVGNEGGWVIEISSYHDNWHDTMTLVLPFVSVIVTRAT